MDSLNYSMSPPNVGIPHPALNFTHAILPVSCCIFSVLIFQACSSPGAVTPSDGSGSMSSPVSNSRSGGSTTVRKSHAGRRRVPAIVGIPPSPSGNAIYRIGPHDLLKIEVFNVDELSSEERVNEDGRIVMPLISYNGITGRMTLLQVIALAEGVKALANEFFKLS